MSVSLRLWPLLMFVAGALCAQTTAWLRSGGPDSLRYITETTASTPMVVTAPNHGFQDGDVVWISYLNGNPAANGVHKVKNVTANSFAVADLDGKDYAVASFKGGVVPNSIDILTAKRPGIKGYVGKVQPYQLVDSLGMYLDGPGGPLTAQIKDPDGRGGKRAPKAVPGWLPYDGMQKRLSRFTTNPAAVLGQDAVTSGAVIHLAALDWFMDNSQKTSLTAAKFWINNIEKFLSNPTFTACNQNYRTCGRGSHVDWMSFIAVQALAGYTLIRSELTPEERQAFIGKMLNDVDDGCTNTLAAGTGTISLSAGSKQVVGNGTKFKTEYGKFPDGRNRWISIRTVNEKGVVSVAWSQVVSVESDTELTLATVVSKVDSYTDTLHWYTGDWQKNSCGVKWFVSNHAASPNVLTRRYPARLAAPVSENDTTITVDTPSNFPSSAPFFVTVRGNKTEAMWVTEIDGNTFKVARGAFGTELGKYNKGIGVAEAPYPAFGGADVTSNYFFVPMDLPYHNLTFCKVYGYFAMGLALANDDPRALKLLEKAWNYYYDFEYPQSKSMWTGITQGGPYYGTSRWSDWSFQIALMMKNNFRPGIDITDGMWLKSQLLYPLYFTMPFDQNQILRYADSGTDPTMHARWYRYILTGQTLYPDSSEAAFANYWYREQARYNDPSRWIDSDSQNSLAFAVIGTSDKNPSTDYRKTLPPFYFFTDHDFNPSWNPNAAYNGLISKQNWGKDATMLWVSAFSQPSDHLGSYAGPGSYKIIKHEYLIAENGSGGQGVMSPFGTNSVQIGTANPFKSERDSPVVLLDRKFGNDQFVYTRVNSTGAYTAATTANRVFRHIVHLKNSPQDYVLVYDDVNTDTPQKKITRVNYYAEDSEKPDFTSDGGLMTFKRKKAMISSKILLPARADALTVETKNPSEKETVYSAALDDGNTQQSEFLIVHRPKDGTSDSMPPVSLIEGAGDAWRAVLIRDGTPKVVIFPRNGSQSPTLNFSLPSEAANAEVLVTGLPPGLYSANGAAGKAVGLHGTLYFTGASGTVSVQRTGSAALEIPPTVLPNGAIAKGIFARLEANGGVEPFTWTVAAGELPPGVTLGSDGLLSGAPSKSGTFNFKLNIQDAEGASTQADYSLTISESQATLEISRASPPTGYVGSAYSYAFAVSDTNSGYSWSVISGSLPSGLSLSTDGTLNGTPDSAGSFAFTIQVSGPTGSVTLDLAIEVQDAPSQLDIQGELPSAATKDSAFSATLTGNGGVAPYSWSISGDAAGLTIDSDGNLTGTPSSEGSFSFTIRLTDATGAFVDKNFSLTVEPT